MNKFYIILITTTLLISGTIVGAFFYLSKGRLISNPDETLDIPDDSTGIILDMGPDEVSVDITGDVVRISDIKVKICGQASDNLYGTSGFVSYTSSENLQNYVLQSYCYEYLNGIDVVYSALEKFYEGDYEDYLSLIPLDIKNYEPYTYSYNGFDKCNLIYLNDYNLYYSIVIKDQEYYILNCPEMFFLTNEPETVRYGDPMSDIMAAHVYNTYEEEATKNTLAQMDSPNANATDNSIFNTSSDKAHRMELLKLEEYDWKSDGTCDETDVTVDLKSASAFASKWVLSENSAYGYADNGLKISNLSGTLSTTSLAIQGSIKNLLDSIRPWVLVIKYLDEQDGLLAVRCINGQSKVIPAYGTTTFSMSIANNEIDIKNVKAIMFEVY